MASPYLRLLTVPEIVQGAFRLYGNSLTPVVLFALAAHLPLLALGNIPADPTPSDAARLGLLMVPILILTGLSVHAIYVVLLGALVDRPIAAPRVALLTLRRVVVTVALTYVATNLVAHIGLLLLVMPGVILGGLMAPSVPAAMVERGSSLQSVWRSFALMRRDVFRGIAIFAFSLLVSEFLPLVFLIGMENLAGSGPFSPLLAAVMGAITLPIVLAANLLLYCSARVGEGTTAESLRKELLTALGLE